VQETKQKALETTDSEPPRKEHFIFRHWITKDSTEEEDNELASHVNGKPKSSKRSTQRLTQLTDGSVKRLPTLPFISTPSIPSPVPQPNASESQQYKKLLIPETNQLTEDIIKACESLKAWWKKELIQQQKD
jgi:hypothetical protein